MKEGDLSALVWILFLKNRPRLYPLSSPIEYDNPNPPSLSPHSLIQGSFDSVPYTFGSLLPLVLRGRF